MVKALEEKKRKRFGNSMVYLFVIEIICQNKCTFCFMDVKDLASCVYQIAASRSISLRKVDFAKDENSNK